MNEPIGITPAELWQIILAVCGAIITVSAAIGVVVNYINKAKEPRKQIANRLNSLDDRLTTVEENQEMFNRNQKRAEKAWVIYMEALMELTNHMIDGNHVENLKAVRNKMQKFITENSVVLERSDDDD